jgi:hypothetical protein
MNPDNPEQLYIHIVVPSSCSEKLQPIVMREFASWDMEDAHHIFPSLENSMWALITSLAPVVLHKINYMILD